MTEEAGFGSREQKPVLDKVATAISEMWVNIAFQCDCTSLYSFSGIATNPLRNQRKALHLLGIEPGHRANPHAQKALWLKRECLPFGGIEPQSPA